MVLFTPTHPGLPTLKDVAQCADFDLTVRPYLPQLYALSSQIASSFTDLQQLQHIYTTTNPVITGLAFAIAITPIFLIVSEINRNYSQVDRVWSILPTIYIAHFRIWASLNGLRTLRLDNILAFSIVWSIRLTYNYWRKGGYQVGSEDYRWEIVQKYVSRPIFFVFNIIFISFIQSMLLFAVTTPVYLLMLSANMVENEMTLPDIIFARLLMGLILVEYFADQQQWDYQNAKKEYQKTAKVPAGFQREDLDRGFIVSGLWAWSRHPNFAAEQSIWVLLYQWSCYDTQTFYNWTLVGALSYLFLFQGSTWLTERISAGKYPEYKEYQRLVGMFVPKLSSIMSDPKEEVNKKVDARKKAE